MGKIFYIMGKSASGKDTIYNQLRNDSSLGLKTVPLYTTRPKRSGEVEGIDYHFISDEDIDGLKGNIIEIREYNTVHGIWKYLTVDNGEIDINKSECYIMIGTLESYCKTKQYYEQKGLKNCIVPIYIYVEDGVRLQRALDREKKQQFPKYEELCRRFLADAADFSEEKLLKANINTYYENINLSECVEKIKKSIKRYMEH